MAKIFDPHLHNWCMRYNGKNFRYSSASFLGATACTWGCKIGHRIGLVIIARKFHFIVYTPTERLLSIEHHTIFLWKSFGPWVSIVKQLPGFANYLGIVPSLSRLEPSSVRLTLCFPVSHRAVAYRRYYTYLGTSFSSSTWKISFGDKSHISASPMTWNYSVP